MCKELIENRVIDCPTHDIYSLLGTEYWRNGSSTLFYLFWMVIRGLQRSITKVLCKTQFSGKAGFF